MHPNRSRTWAAPASRAALDTYGLSAHAATARKLHAVIARKLHAATARKLLAATARRPETTPEEFCWAASREQGARLRLPDHLAAFHIPPLFCQLFCSSSAGPGSFQRGLVRAKRLSRCTTHPGKALSPRLPDGKARRASVSSDSPTPGTRLLSHHPPGRRGSCAGSCADTWGSSCRCLRTRNANSRGQDDLLGFASKRWPKKGAKLPCGEARAGGEEPVLPQGRGRTSEWLSPGFTPSFVFLLAGFPQHTLQTLA